MNEDLQKALAEFVKGSLLSLQQGKEFALAQAPDLIQQLLRWKFWEAIGEIAVSLVLIGIFVRYFKTLVAGADECTDHPGWVVMIIMGFIISLVSLIAILIDSFTVLQILIAPKVWLLEWALAQVKG